MSAANRQLVERLNKTFEANDVEGLLAHCADDFEWTMVGEKPLRGKDAVRAFMSGGPSEPPAFTVDAIVAEGDYVTCIGDMTMKQDGKVQAYSYCDVWRIHDGKVVSLKAFVIRTDRAQQG